VDTSTTNPAPHAIDLRMLYRYAYLAVAAAVATMALKTFRGS
jgi:hypothetical protein